MLKRDPVRICRFFGIEIFLGPSWVLGFVIFSWAFYPFWKNEVGEINIFWCFAISTLFTLLIYFGLLIHELGHALIAKKMGHEALSVYLFALSAITIVIKNETRKLTEEVKFYLAGPLAGFVFAISLWFAYLALKILTKNSMPILSTFLLNSCIAVYIISCLLNLIPILPLDGGNVLLLILSHKTKNPAKAVRVSIKVSIIIATITIIAGIFVGTVYSFIWSIFFLVIYAQHLVSNIKLLQKIQKQQGPMETKRKT